MRCTVAENYGTHDWEPITVGDREVGRECTECGASDRDDDADDVRSYPTSDRIRPDRRRRPDTLGEAIHGGQP